MISILQPGQQVTDLSAEANAFELRRCPFHPNYNVEVYCAQENFEPSVMCIKCYLDPELSKRIRGEPLIAIRDLILKSLQIDSTRGTLFLQSKAEILEQKFLEMVARDHVSIFKRHADTQMRKLDTEIERLKQSLDELRAKFVEFFEKQAKTLENKQDEIERKVYNFLLEKEEIEKRSYGSLEELLEELNSLEDFKEYEKFVRLLYKKSQFDEEGREGTSLKKIFDLIENKENLLTNMKAMRIDTGILEEMRATINSIEVVDKATSIPAAGTLDPKIERTLDKIRKVGEKVTPGRLTPLQQTLAEVREGSKNPSPYKEKEKEKELPTFSRLLEVLREKKSTTPSPYKGKATPSQKISEIVRDKNAVASSPQRGGTSMDIESENRGEIFGGEERKPTIGLTKGKSLLENLREKYDPFGLNKPASVQKSETGKPSIQKQKTIEKEKVPYNPAVVDLEEGSNKQAPEISFGWQHSEQFDQAVPSTMPIENEGVEESFGKPEESLGKPKESSNQNITGTLLFEPTLQDQPTESKKKDTEGAVVIESESSEQEKKHESRSPSIQESSRENMVQQWIDQKLNGFVVFQNTLKEQEEAEKIEDFNKYSSQHWIQLGKPEKDEYTTLAVTKREQLKEEFRNLCRDIEDISELQELLDQKIKKVKK